MTSETSNRKPVLSVFEAALVFACVWIVSQTLTSSWAFHGFWTAIPLAILAGVLAVAQLIRSRIAYALPFATIAVLIGAINLATIPKMFPLRHPVRAAAFTDASVADILHHIAKSQDDPPYWRFNVSDQELAYTRITLTIAENASLADTLDVLVVQTGASYTWNWHKFFGNDPSPLCASFYLTGDPTRDRNRYELLIDRHGIVDTALKNR